MEDIVTPIAELDPDREELEDSSVRSGDFNDADRATEPVLAVENQALAPASEDFGGSENHDSSNLEGSASETEHSSDASSGHGDAASVEVAEDLQTSQSSSARAANANPKSPSTDATEGSGRSTEQATPAESEAEARSESQDEEEADAAPSGQALPETSSPPDEGAQGESGSTSSQDAGDWSDAALGHGAGLQPNSPDSADGSADQLDDEEAEDPAAHPDIGSGSDAEQYPDPSDTCSEDIQGSEGALGMPLETLSARTQDILVQCAELHHVHRSQIRPFWFKRMVFDDEDLDKEPMFILYGRKNSAEEVQGRTQLYIGLSEQFGVSKEQVRRLRSLAGVSPALDVQQQLQQEDEPWQHVMGDAPPFFYFYKSGFYRSVADLVEGTKDALVGALTE